MFNVVGILLALLGLAVGFLPSILAVLRGNVYRGQVIKYQLLIAVVHIVVNAATWLITAVLKVKFIVVILSIANWAWGLISLILWFYILINAIRDTEMTLLSRFGINI